METTRSKIIFHNLSSIYAFLVKILRNSYLILKVRFKNTKYIKSAGRKILHQNAIHEPSMVFIKHFKSCHL